MQQVQRDIFEKAFNITERGSTTSRKEKYFLIQLLSHDFIVGVIDEETDMFLTLIAIVMSTAITVAILWVCFFGVIKPYFLMLKAKFEKRA